MDYVENLLQSIDQIVHHRLRDQKFDETIICTVTDTSKASRGLYVVSDGTIKFDAYSELTDYKVDEAVRVNIPKGDYSQKKYIIGRSVSEKNGNQPIVYNSPSAKILDISGNLCTNTEAKIIANGDVKEVLIWSNERLSEDYANSIYDSILISAQFQTFFSPYNISKGTYGLRLKVIIAPKKVSDKIICREYDLDSRDMFGDPYNYLLPSLQEAKFNFDVNENIQQMSLYLYQNDDFKYKTEAGEERELGVALAENIHVSNVHIALGTNLSTMEDNTVKIYTDDDLTYNSVNGTNQKAIKLIWYNKDNDHRYVGFSDGVVDASYDEMDYDKAMSNHNRLMIQASQGNIPDDYAGFELGARMSEIGTINTSLKKLIDKDLYSNLKKFRNDLAPVNNSKINTSFQTIINYMENEGQAILTQLDSLYNFYLQGLNFAAAASQKKLYYQSSDQKYYIIKELLDETQRDEIEKVEGLSSQHEEPLFGILDDNNWNNINDGSLGELLLKIANNLNEINNEVQTYAANYLGVFNNWQKKIQDILDKIKINTLNLQKISAGRSYPMYSLGEDIDTEVDGGPSKNYYSRDLFEAEGDNTFDKGLLNRITTPTSESGFCGFDSQTYSDTISTDDDNKYQIYWYYERNGYIPGEGENPYGGPGWCEIEDNGSINNVGRFTILNPSVKNIGLPQPTGDGYPTKPDENDQNGYLSISFSSNRPDIKEEKIKCVIIYNHQKYESNILTFKNEDPATGPELTNAIQLIHGKNSRDIYACYNADNTLTNASDKVTPRELKIQYLNERGEPETGENSTLIGSTVYWYVPTGVTMLTVNNKDVGIDNENNIGGFKCGSAIKRTYNITDELKLQYETKQYAIEDLVYGGITYKFSEDNKQIISSNGQKYVIRNNQVTLPVDEPDEYDREGFAYYYKTINSIDDLTFKYRIKEHYSQSFVNNTILCKVVKNNRVLEDSKMFTFSSQGVNGTNYSLVINAEDGVHAFFNDKYNFSISLFDYDGNQIPFTTQPEVKFYNNTTIELQETLSNEDGVLVYKGTVELINTSNNSPNHLIVTTTQPWPINSNAVSDNTDNVYVKNTNTITLKKIQPIAYAQNTAYIAEVPTEIIYNSSGSDPSYYKEPLRLYEKQPNGDLQLVLDGYWTIINNTNNFYLPVLEGQTLSDGEPKKYKNGLASLKPLNMYVTTQKGFDFCILQYQSNDNNTVLWSQPIVIMQNRFPSTLLNNWDGSLQINTKDGTILSNLVGAGKKNDNNEFSGVLMGDIDKSDIDNTDGGVLFNPHTGMGLYGFHNGSQSFGFNVDGTAFIGKAGGGRIAFDGNQGFIYSANWLRSFEKNGQINITDAFPISGETDIRTIGKGSKGMAIDLYNGRIDAYNFKLSSEGIQLNSSPISGESYFVIGKNTANTANPCLQYTNDGELILRVNEMEFVGTSPSPNLLNNSYPWFYDINNFINQAWYISGQKPIYVKYDHSDNAITLSGAEESFHLVQNFINSKTGLKYQLTGEIQMPAEDLAIQERTITFGLGDHWYTQQFIYSSPQNEWQKFNISFTLDENETRTINKIVVSADKFIKMRKIKLELNDNSTEWSASAQDIAQKNISIPLNQDYIFNQLTNYGRAKGIYLGDYNNDGSKELYINANYISTGIITDDATNGTNLSINLNDGTIIGKKVTIQGENNSYIKCENGKISINADELYIGGSAPSDGTMSSDEILSTLSSGWTGIQKEGNDFIISATSIQTGTIDADDVTIINLKANNITGALSSAVTIGGWHISDSSIESYTNNSFDQTTTYHMRLFGTDQSNYIAINSSPKNDWRIVAGSNFGVDKNGVLYATDAHLTGIINAQRGGAIGPWQISENNLFSTGGSYIDARGGFRFTTNNGNVTNSIEFQPLATDDNHQTYLWIDADIKITEGHHIYIGNTQVH